MKKSILTIFLLSVVALSANAITIAEMAANAKEKAKRELQGYSVSDINLTTITNEVIDVSSLDDKTTILFFFATWSPASQTSIEYMSNFYKRNKGLVNIIGMNNESITQEELESYLTENNIDFKVAQYSNSQNYKQFEKYPVSIIPTTYVFDKEYRLIERYEGEYNGDLLTNLVKIKDKIDIEIWKSPTCGCCIRWIEHLKKNDFNVISHNTGQMQQVKDELGVPVKLRSCHTAKVGDLIIEGHVPAKDIIDVISTDVSSIELLSVPGMPSGTPGMENGMNDPYAVIAVKNKEGAREGLIYKKYNERVEGK